MPIALIIFHHFYSPKKLALLLSLSKKLICNGIYQRGRPGILLLSSSSPDSLARYITEVKVCLSSPVVKLRSWTQRMRWQRVDVRGVAEMELNLKGLREVEGRVRDVVRVAGEEGGVEVERWVKEKMGFVKGSE